MMRLVLLLTVAACSGADQAPDGQHARTGGVGYEAPLGWKQDNTQTHTSVTSTWTPENNSAKESVSVVWAAVVPVPTDPDQLGQLLVRAEQGLLEATVSKPVAITSARGLKGFQIESEFTASSQRYHRVHAVLLDGTALVHVFYVAVESDDKLESYRLVLHSVTNEEG
jgi:hypothetical protein